MCVHQHHTDAANNVESLLRDMQTLTASASREADVCRSANRLPLREGEVPRGSSCSRKINYQQRYSYTSTAKGWQATTTRPTESLYMYTRGTRFFVTDSEVLSAVHATCACFLIVKNIKKFVDAQSSMEHLWSSAAIYVSVNDATR